MSKRKTSLLILGLVLLAVIVAAYFLVQTNQKESPQDQTETMSQDEPSEEMVEDKGEESANATQELINEAKDEQEQESSEDIENKNEMKDMEPNSETSSSEVGTTSSEQEVAQEEATSTESEPTSTEPDTVEVTENTSGINTETGDVVDEEGDKVSASEDADVENQPQVSGELSEEDVPENGIYLKMYSDRIEPDTFTVSPDQAVSLSATAKDDNFHTLKFKDESLSGMFLSVVEGEIRSVTFNAPEETGEYQYYDAMANFENQGAKGTMVVK